MNDKEQYRFLALFGEKGVLGCERHKTHFDSQVKWILGNLGSSRIF
jgi:hypothetical protein